MFASVSFANTTFSAMSLAVRFVSSRFSINSMSSRMSPLELESFSSRESSSCLSVIVNSESCFTSVDASSCRSGLSFPTTSASSWSSSPRCVTQKFTSVVCAFTSGL